MAEKESVLLSPSKKRTMSPAVARFHYVCVTTFIALSIDLITKLWAVRHLSTTRLTHLGPLTLHLVYNLGSTVHPVPATLAYLVETRLLTAAILVGMLFVLKSRLAAVGIGLMFAAGLGNFLSLAMYPHRVPDFLVIGHIGTANVADFFAATGLIVVACALTLFIVRTFRDIKSEKVGGAKVAA